MEEKNLEFQESYTVEQFKAMQHLTEDQKIQVKKNPKTEKLFFSWGPGKQQTGAVAKAGVPKKPVISKVKGDPTPENTSGVFFLLHEEGEGGAPVIATF
jgi:hypothetical protein